MKSSGLAKNSVVNDHVRRYVRPPMSEAVIERAGTLVWAAGANCDAAARLRDIAGEIRAESLVLKVRAQEVRRARSIYGGAGDSEAARLVDAIGAGALCAQCLSRKTSIAIPRIDEVLVGIGHTLRVTVAVALCDACGKQTVVHQLG
jgi:hypothetical protein